MKRIFSLLAISLLTMSAWAANTYVKVTSLDQLEEGMKYILVNEEASVAMGDLNTSGSNNFGTAVSVTISDAVIDIDGTDVVELTTVGRSQDVYGNTTWNFRMGEDSRYIGWVSGNSLTAVNAPGSNNTQWIPTLTDDGVILKNRLDNTRILQYNAGAPRFACYTSSQKPAVLYKQGAPEDEGINTLSEANALEDNAEFTFDGDAVVTVFKNGYLFLRDESGYAMISGVQGNFENGQVLSQGWNATKTSNDGWVSYTDAAGLSASGETDLDLAAAIVPYSVDESLLNAFVCIKNQAPSFFPARNFTLPDGTTIPKTENLWAGDADATTGNYNVYGVICKFGGKLMFNILSYENYVEPGMRGDVNKSNDVTIADVSALIDYLLTGDSTGISLENADCNLKDDVTIADVSALIDFLLTGSWSD